MSQPSQMPAQQRISDLKVSGHLMTLQTGLFCIFHTPGQPPPSASGLPGVRISRSPLTALGQMEIVTFEHDGWIGAQTGAALVRVHQGPAQVMVTIYQEMDTLHEAPGLQVVQLSAQADAQNAPQQVAPEPMAQQQRAAPAGQVAQQPAQPEIGAHIQRQGDVGARLGEWMGQPGSHAWIEGFGISPSGLVSAEDIEYQAVLGKGWLSPWVEGGKYCGSRGMALPILGLCVRLKNKAEKQYICRLTATFTDGTQVGPLEANEPVEAPTLAPLEAFLLEILPRQSVSLKGRKKAAILDPAVAAADLAALLDEDGADSEKIEQDFALFIEDEIEKIDQHQVAAKPRGRGRGSKSAPLERASAARASKRVSKEKVSQKNASEKETGSSEPVKRGRGRPARRVAEAAVLPRAHAVGRRRKVLSRR